jgi:hypothetical protein
MTAAEELSPVLEKVQGKIGKEHKTTKVISSLGYLNVQLDIEMHESSPFALSSSRKLSKAFGRNGNLTQVLVRCMADTIMCYLLYKLTLWYATTCSNLERFQCYMQKA